MKAHHLTATTNPVAEAHPIYKEAYNFARELNKLTEGKQLNVGEIHTLFTNAEQAMTAGGGNRTMLGKAGEMAGALGAKIKGLAQALQDTTPVKGVDSMFDDLKQKASTAMGKSTQGSSVLRALDQYKQIVQKHPNTSKFFWGVAGVLTGILTGGAGPVVALGAIKMIDSMVQGHQLSTSVGSGLKTAGTAMGAKAIAHAGSAAANTIQNFDPNTLNPFHHNPVDPNAPVVDPNAPVVDPNAPVVDPNAPVKPVDPNAPVNPVTPGAETQTITIKQGDTLSQLADKYKVNPDEIAKLNPGKFGPDGNPNIIHPGDQIVLPKNIDAAAYKGAYQGDHAMTAQNINAKTQAGQYGSDGGMSAKAVANAKAAAGSKAATAQTPAPSASAPPRAPVPDIFDKLGQQRAESFKFKAGRELLEGIQLIVLPTSMMVDKQSTVQKWALNESLGRKRNSVQLTEAGVMTLFMNLQRIDEAVYDRPGNANDPRAMAKNKPAPNTSNTAGPQGQLPGGNVGGLATGQAPAGNTMPYLAADPEGKFDTKYKGATSTGASRGVETGLGRLGNWVKDKWKDSTTKVTANGLKRHWKDAGSPTDSDQIASILQRLKVPNEMITQLYQQLNFPAPALPAEPAQQAGGGGADARALAALPNAGGGAGQAQQAGGAEDAEYAQATQGLPPAPEGYRYRVHNGEVAYYDRGRGRQEPALDPIGGNSEDLLNQIQQSMGGGGGSGGSVSDRLMGGGQQGGGQQGGGQGGMAGDGKVAQATATILPLLARMTNPGYADDLITVIDTALSVLQRSAPTAYREKIAQLRKASASVPREKPQDTVNRVKQQAASGGSGQQQAPRNPLGPSRIASNNPGAPTNAERANFDQRVAQATGTRNESRKRTYGGKYIKETADQKLAREFENFLLKQE